MPRKARRVSGLRLDQIYTRVLERAEPRKGTAVVRLLSARRDVVAYRSSQEKTAGEVPEPCSKSRLYRCIKKTWKRRSRLGGPK